MQQRALQVGERDVLVHRETLDLRELGSVCRVEIAPVDPTGDDHVERRRMKLHRAHLHRRGVGAQQRVAPGAIPARVRRGLTCLRSVCGVGDIEGVGSRPRGVRRAVVERVEVVVDGLDLGAFHDGEAEAQEDVFELAPGRAQHVQAPERLRRRARQCDVDAILDELGVELGARELGTARLDQRLERLAGGVRRLADGGALLGLELRDLAQHLRQLGLAAEIAHPQLLELSARRGRADRGLGLPAKLLDAVAHQPGTLDARRVIS